MVVRTVTFGASSGVTFIGSGLGSLGFYCALGGALRTLKSKDDDLSHIVGSVISVPAMFIASPFWIVTFDI